MNIKSFFYYRKIRLKEFYLTCYKVLCSFLLKRYKHLPPIKIGFLRLANEENTIIPCLLSVDYMFDKIVLIYSEVTDNTLNLVYDYIKKNNLEDKYIIRQYPYKVLPPHSKEYFDKTYKKENSLAAYYNFGWQICCNLAKGRDGFIAKIDADQIYLQNCFNQVLELMDSDNYIYLVNSCGIDGHVINRKYYQVDYSHDQSNGFNGWQGDHIIIPNALLHFFKPFFMEIKFRPYKIAWEIRKIPFLLAKKSFGKCMWFHFDCKKPWKPTILKNISPEQEKLYLKEVYPLLEKANSPYKDLILYLPT